MENLAGPVMSEILLPRLRELTANLAGSEQGVQAALSYLTRAADNLSRLRLLTIQLTEKEDELCSLHHAVELAAEGVARVTPDGHFIYCNRVYPRLTGYSPEELLGMTWRALVAEETRQRLEPLFERMEASGPLPEDQMLDPEGTPVEDLPGPALGNWFRSEVTLICKDGTWTWVELTGCAYWIDSTLQGYYLLLRDINHRRRNEEHLRNLVDQVQARRSRPPLKASNGPN